MEGLGQKCPEIGQPHVEGMGGPEHSLRERRKPHTGSGKGSLYNVGGNVGWSLLGT